VLFCAEAGRPLDEEESAFLSGLDPARALLVRTTRLIRLGADEAHRALASVVTSAVDGTGLFRLREELLRLAFGGILGEPGEAPLVTRERHARALRAARVEIALFRDALRSDVPPEFASTHLRAAADRLEELIGAVTPDDVLGELFGEFCVGK
jgi:tRNA modification GTPase